MVTALLLARFAEDQSAVVQTASWRGFPTRHCATPSSPSDHGRGAERPVRERAPADIAVIKLDSSGPTSLSARLSVNSQPISVKRLFRSGGGSRFAAYSHSGFSRASVDFARVTR
jgi:hypothetical protein